MNYNSTELDQVLEALSNSRRRDIIHDLSLSPATIKQLADRHKLSLPAIHKHIKVFEQAELIIRKKKSRTNFVALNTEKLRMTQNWINQYKTEWGSPQATLENYVSGMRQ